MPFVAHRRPLALPAALALGLGLALALATSARGQADASVARAVQYLRGTIASRGPGEAALAGLALVKSGVPRNDPAVAAALGILDRRFSGTTYTPELGTGGGPSIYEAGVTILLYANLDPEGFRPRIEAAASYILSCQLPAGSWDYPHRRNGDTSISQYAVLGLWEAENAGVPIPPRAWDQAARWYLSAQDNDGGWRYHPDEGGRATVSMTAAGVGSLLICRRQLEPYRQVDTGKSKILKPLVTDPRGFGNYDASVASGTIDAAVRRGLAWLGNHFNVGKNELMGQSVYYGLYGIERIGALADRQQLGGVDWFGRGAQFIRGSQEATGAWAAQHGEVPNTAWGVLFLTKSTAQSVRKLEIKRLGSGTLIGGRGLPQDLSSLTVAGGRVMASPMSGAIDEMLTQLEDPRSEQADSALAGLVKRYRTEGPAALRPHQVRFTRLLASDPDPGIRDVAAWALGRTGDLAGVLPLIAALEDPEERVIQQARLSLQLLSRKVDGLGPAPGADPAARKTAAARWRAWYDAIRPPVYSSDPEPR